MANGEKGFTDGATATVRFNGPRALVVDGEGVIVAADTDNHRLRKIVGGQVTTLAGSSEPGTADGAGAVARFNGPNRLALDERGRLLVVEIAGFGGRKDTLRVVEASLALPLWMGPVEQGAQDSEAAMPAKTQAEFAALENYGKLLEDGALADVVLLVKGERFPAHRGVLAARSECVYGLFLSGMQGGGFGGWGAGDRASERGGVPGGAAVPVHG